MLDSIFPEETAGLDGATSNMPVARICALTICRDSSFTERASRAAQQPQVDARAMESVATTAELPNSIVIVDFIQTNAALGPGTEVTVSCTFFWQGVDLIWCEAAESLAL